MTERVKDCARGAENPLTNYDARDATTKTERTKRYRYSLTDEDISRSKAERGEIPCDWCGKPHVETPNVDHDNTCCVGEGNVRSCGKCVRGFVHFLCNLEIAKCEWVEREFAAIIPKLIDYKRRFPVPRRSRTPSPTESSAVYASLELQIGN